MGSHLLRRFANVWGCQWWNPTMICWGLGAFGLGLTGVLETNTKEDMGEHADLILLWGANLASQPNTGRHLTAARRRGAHIVAIDVRETEAAAQADEVIRIRPGTDAALALAMMHVSSPKGVTTPRSSRITRWGSTRSPPTWARTRRRGGGRLRCSRRAHRRPCPALRGTKPAMIVLGGSSMHKGANGWQASRAIACLPALTGNLGIPGACSARATAPARTART